MVEISDQEVRTATLEAFADTIIPGQRREPTDRAIAGVSTGGGAVAAGAVELMEGPEGGIAPALDDLARALNGQAMKYAAENEVVLDSSAPAFVALPFAHRTALVRQLTALDNPEREVWVGMAIFSYMAFDSAAHMHTTDALAAGHVGLTTMGFIPPEPDGSWRFPNYSYRRQLAPMHPGTTDSGSPS